MILILRKVVPPAAVPHAAVQMAAALVGHSDRQAAGLRQAALRVAQHALQLHAKSPIAQWSLLAYWNDARPQAAREKPTVTLERSGEFDPRSQLTIHAA